jgi:hypothetical protein
VLATRCALKLVALAARGAMVRTRAAAP